MVLKKAVQSTAIVSSIFPKSVQERLMASSDADQELVSANHRLKSFLKGDEEENVKANNGLTPIADLFPHCTVMFAGTLTDTATDDSRSNPVTVSTVEL